VVEAGRTTEVDVRGTPTGVSSAAAPTATVAIPAATAVGPVTGTVAIAVTGAAADSVVATGAGTTVPVDSAVMIGPERPAWWIPRDDRSRSDRPVGTALTIGAGDGLVGTAVTIWAGATAWWIPWR
jgi:hypothetical protein